MATRPGRDAPKIPLEHEDSSIPTQQNREQTNESTELGTDPDFRMAGPAV
jgi:hypothetical protein